MFAYPLKVNSQCFKLHIDLIQFHLICEMLAKFSVVEFIRPYVSLEKQNKNNNNKPLVLSSRTPSSGRVKLESFISQSCNDG